ncbi:MAG: 6-phospho-beta-glucosidase [Clostridia bacterium]|nr:6-phospho-beta-glucosidase [Clostridia bacterium]MBR3552318.1 6-phospho-beta-glucosidase [Clostridia bacterium]
MKLAVIGGGGVRSMFLAKSIAQKAAALHMEELVFMDNNEKKLNIYGKMAKVVAQKLNPDLRFVLTTDAVEAIRGADYVITTIRVGEDDMRVRDERIALDLGLLGQETTGAAGLSFAMRSVDALAHYCDLVRQYAKPGCKVFNFTNPAGVVSQTLRDMGYNFTYGICDAPSGMLRTFEKLYDAPEGSAKGEIYGLNHLSYFSSIKIGGKEVLHEIIENDRAYTDTDLRYFEKSLLRERGAILNEYLYYYYYREKAVANILAAPQTRGEQIAEINRKMTAELEQLDVERDFDKALAIFEHWYGERENNYMAAESGVKRQTKWHFDVFAKDDGGYAGVALKFMEIERSGKRDSMILCVPNCGAIEGLLDTDVVEITCDIWGGKAFPHRFLKVDEQNLELIRRVKIYERLASEAIRTKSRTKAIEALTLHPLVASYSLATQLADAYLELNKAYTGEWT